jgi:SAM-dependent methyltransferase
MIDIRHGDCIEQMRAMDDACVDSIVTDPPYELGFMGKGWDATGIANSVEMWREAYRVLKPGGHLLAFSSTRTYHRMVCAIEDAGFEVRDQIGWMYGTGFPKAEQWTQAKADKGHAESAALVAAGFEGWARGGCRQRAGAWHGSDEYRCLAHPVKRKHGTAYEPHYARRQFREPRAI